MTVVQRSTHDGPIDVSILMPVLNEGRYVERALASALHQRCDGQLEVLVVDGGSTDDTVAKVTAIAGRDPRARLLHNPGRLTASGLNVGLRAARGTYIARMDGHCFFPPHYVACGIDRLERGDVDWVMGSPFPEAQGKWSRRVALALGTWLGAGGPRFRSNTTEVEVGTSVSNGVMRRRDVLDYGGWDEDWTVNEDVVLAARMRRDGRRIVSVPELAAAYAPRDNMAQLAHQYWRYGRYRVKTSRRYPECLRPSHLLAPGLVILIALAGARSRREATVARGALTGYALALVSASARVGAKQGARLPDIAWTPLVLGTMHVAWGSGFLIGCVASGPPWAALVRMLQASERGAPST